MSVVLREVGSQLVGVIARLEGMHRDGLTPNYGQVEELFDLGKQLEAALKLSAPALPCSIDACGRPAAATVDSRPYCARCASALRAVTTQVATDAPSIARTRVESMVQGKAPWPSSATAGADGTAAR